ncbi:MAG: hypothetical protein M3Z07_03160 [Candidatus Eremiobacteraeota bacterium]|nr:hypothetical protein [Candidatus Eremiobacteraeota bacterium]
MLLNAFVMLGIIALTVATLLETIGALANTTTRRIAARYADGGYTWAAKRVRDGIASQISAGVDPSGPFSSLPPASYCATSAQPCDFFVDPRIEITVASLATPFPCVSGQSCASNLQKNPYVSESRVSARITVIVAASGGPPLARRQQYLALRTFRSPPYVATVGVSDDAGLVGSTTPVPCASRDPAATFSQDTVVNAVYQNAQTGACIDAGSRSSQAWQNPSEASATP